MNNIRERVIRVFVICIIVLAFVGVVHAEWQNSLRPKGEQGPQLELSQNGQTDYVIVIPEKHTQQEHKAASELSRWLGEMTDAHSGWGQRIEQRTLRHRPADGTIAALVLRHLRLDHAADGIPDS